MAQNSLHGDGTLLLGNEALLGADCADDFLEAEDEDDMDDSSKDAELA